MKKKIVVVLIFILMLLLVLSYEVLNYAQENSSWKITQYGDNDGAQMMCFTVEGNKNGLVIIDGGYEDSEEQVENLKKVISQHNNKIDAWIITHLDSDHAGVFLNIYQNCPEIQIEKIYTANIPDLELAKEKAKWMTTWKTYEDFCNLDLKNLQCLSENDIIDNIIGLKMEVLWSYSDWVYKNSANLLNNGSLVFKLYGKNENMLFCADTQSKNIGDVIIQRHKDNLKSDYLQVAHHGNNSFTDEFYNIVSPKTAFICAPDSLINNIDNISWFTVGDIKKKLEDSGVTIYSDNTSPNTIIIH